MPIDYSLYDPSWKTVIRPDILKRAKDCCEQCNIPNGKIVLRGTYNGVEAYQDMDGNIYNAANSEYINSDYLGEVDESQKNQIIKVVLTISHTDHVITNNDYSNLKALCQQCHNRHDKGHRKESREKNKKQIKLF